MSCVFRSKASESATSQEIGQLKLILPFDGSRLTTNLILDVKQEYTVETIQCSNSFTKLIDRKVMWDR
jgi:hypothetical protein